MSYFQFSSRVRYSIGRMIFFFTSVGQGFYPPKCQHSKKKKKNAKKICGRGEINYSTRDYQIKTMKENNLNLLKCNKNE